MSLTGVTWLTGEVIDETRLNYMVDNLTYAKSLFTSGTPWLVSSWTGTEWVDILPRYSTGQVIDSIRLNQMYTNQFALRSIEDEVIIWDDESREQYDDIIGADYVFDWSFYLKINGTKIGSTIYPPTTQNVWQEFAVTNIPIDSYPDFTPLKMTIYHGWDTSPSVRFIKTPQMKYISYWVTLGFNSPEGYARNGRENFIVIGHNEFTSW